MLLLRIRHYKSSDFGSTQISAVNEYLPRVYCILSNSEGTAQKRYYQHGLYIEYYEGCCGHSIMESKKVTHYAYTSEYKK